MQAEQRSLALLNVIGGLAVLGSYALAFVISPDIRAGLWGGVPESLRGLYTVNMFLAAAGYFPFTAVLVLKSTADSFRTETGWPHLRLVAFYGLVLVPSAMWLPLTALMIENPSTLLWWTIRLVLFAVGIGGLGLLVSALRVARARGGALPWLGFTGTLPFFLQTGILDALVWPAYYPH